jgi:hypothetical protein
LLAVRLLVPCKPAPNGIMGAKVRAALLEELPGRWEPLERAVTLRLRFLFVTESPVPLEAPSVAALTRTVLDELPGIVYREEQQLASLHVRKERSNVSGVELSW